MCFIICGSLPVGRRTNLRVHSDRFGLVWFGLVSLVWIGWLVWFGLVEFSLVWFGLVWFGLFGLFGFVGWIWFGQLGFICCFVWFGLVWFGLVYIVHIIHNVSLLGFVCPPNILYENNETLRGYLILLLHF